MAPRAAIAMLAPLLLVAACRKEPSFDDRFAGQAANIQDRAEAMQAELANRTANMANADD